MISDYQPPEGGPEIVIRPGENEVFYEYRVNGQLMEIKVVPETGRLAGSELGNLPLVIT